MYGHFYASQKGTGHSPGKFLAQLVSELDEGLRYHQSGRTLSPGSIFIRRVVSRDGLDLEGWLASDGPNVDLARTLDAAYR